MIGGVAGGLAEYSGVDPLLWRVGFVALTFAGGSGILVYLLLWLLMPAGPPGDPGNSRSRWTHGRSERPPAGPRSPVPGVTIAGLLIVVGLLVLATHFSGWDVGPRGFLGAALLVVGLGLVVAAFTGGRTARGGLIALGIVLSLALVAVSSLPWRHGDGRADATYRPTSTEDVRSLYRGGFGDMTVDLGDVPLTGLDQPIRTRIQHGVGDLRVLVPASADVQVRVDQGLGDVTIFGDRGATDGLFRGTGSTSWTGDDSPEIVLDINSGFGDVEVSRG
jgi:phage shock protein PspC (stress-responsive transcriptional regulator)